MSKLNGGTIHRNIKYPGDEDKAINPIIFNLNKEFIETNNKLAKIRKDIEEFQSNCKHEYYLVYESPAYDDCYRCIHCGKEEWF